MTTAPVFRVPVLPAHGSVRLDGLEGRHAAGVRRLTVGERVDLVDGTGGRGLGVVTSVHGREAITIDLRERTDEPVPDPYFVVVQALPKGDRGEQAVELMTEAGVDEIVPWAASRCVTRWSGERGDRARRRWQSTADEAAKQSRRARWPVVTPQASATDVAAGCAQADWALVLHESAGVPLAGVGPIRGRVLLVVGPEGGIEDGELGLLEAAGARPVRLGREVVRASSAGALGLAVLSAGGRWSA